MNCNDILLFYSEYKRKYQASSQYLALNHRNKEDRTTYFDFLTERHKL